MRSVKTPTWKMRWLSLKGMIGGRGAEGHWGNRGDGPAGQGVTEGGLSDAGRQPPGMIGAIAAWWWRSDPISTVPMGSNGFQWDSTRHRQSRHHKAR